MELALPLLTPVGWLLCTTNQRSLSNGAFQHIISAALPAANRTHLRKGSMPSDFTGEQYLQTVWVDV